MTAHRYLTLRTRHVGVRVRRRDLAVTAAAVLVVAVAFLVTLATGDYQTSPGEVLRVLGGSGEAGSRLVVETFRLPRASTAVLVGVALGASGSVFQAVARNPLVAPDVIGVNGGASIAALVIIIGGGPQADIPVAAFGGGLAAAGLGYLLAYRTRRDPYRLLIIGVGINALTGSVLSYLFLVGDADRVRSAADWLLGSFVYATWPSTGATAVAVAAATVLLAVTAPSLGLLQLGEPTAASLGLRVARQQLGLLVAATALASVAVAFTGPIGFVAFLAPNLARRLTGTAGPGALVAAAATGAALTLLADLAAQRLFAPVSLPVGVVTVALGGPYFLLLLLRRPRGAAV